MKTKTNLLLIFLIITIRAGFAQDAQQEIEYPNLVTNGDFEDGNVGFKSDFISEDFLDLGYYVITDNVAQYLGGGTFVNPFPNTGKYFVVRANEEKKKKRLWYDSITVKPNTAYEFSFILANIYYQDRGYGSISLKVNGEACCPCHCSLLEGSKWGRASIQYKTGPDETRIEISIVDEYLAGDVALDNIEFKQLEGDTTTIITGELIEKGEPTADCGVLATGSAFVFKNDRDGSKAYIGICCPELFKKSFFVIGKKYKITCTKSQIKSCSVYNPKNYTNLLFERSIERLD